MQRLWPLAILVILAAPAAAASPIVVAFTGPASFQGNLEISGTWALLEFAPGASASIDVPGIASAEWHYDNRTWVSHAGPTGSVQVPTNNESTTYKAPLAGFTADWKGGGFLAIKAESIRARSSALASVEGLPSGDASGLRSLTGDDVFSGWAAVHATGQVLSTISQPTAVVMEIRGLQAIELAGAQIRNCLEQHACPRGGLQQSQQVGDVRLTSRSFERLGGLAGDGLLQGSTAAFRLGGQHLDLDVDGEIRLPRGVVAGECACDLDGEATLALAGAIGFHAIEAGGDDGRRLSAKVSGDGIHAFSDGQLVLIPVFEDKTVLVAAAVGAAAIGFVSKFLFALFTRLGKQEALEHPKRQKIFAYVQEHPGANFREVARQTHIAAGTVRHHLTVLERAGHLVEHQHNGTVRLFENHGKFDHNWADLVLLREPPLAQLHQWIKEHPASPQKIILEAMEHQGWSRSTAQHRLARLVDGGLLTIRLQGRLKIYSVAERAPPRPGPGLLPVGPPMPA